MVGGWALGLGNGPYFGAVPWPAKIAWLLASTQSDPDFLHWRSVIQMKFYRLQSSLMFCPGGHCCMTSASGGTNELAPDQPAGWATAWRGKGFAQWAGSFSGRFIQRWDLYAQQLEDGRYLCVHKQLTPNHITAHLLGKITLGTYLLDTQSQARFIVLDADTPEQFARLVSLQKRLIAQGVPLYLEASRRGGHAWVFFAHPVTGEAARAFGLGLMTAFHLADVELFPKQDRLAGGPGSLMRLPLGVHRKTGRRYGFLSLNAQDLGTCLGRQLQALATPQTVSEAAFRKFLGYEPAPPPIARPVRFGDPRDPTLEQIKSGISLMEFIGQFVELRPIGSGAIGRCPFHADHRPSFGVNAANNYWHCFAGCGGGSILDFWMQWRKCSFSIALKELAGMDLADAPGEEQALASICYTNKGGRGAGTPPTD